MIKRGIREADLLVSWGGHRLTPFNHNLNRVITYLYNNQLFSVRGNSILFWNFICSILESNGGCPVTLFTVKQLPEQLNTMVGRQGIRLSGGQRQRLAIARMILTHPKLIILDEATSALDTETENNLHQSLKSYLADKTTLIIAHRLSAVKQADRIVVIDNGQIIADGSHKDLVNSNELYFRLYGMQ